MNLAAKCIVWLKHKMSRKKANKKSKKASRKASKRKRNAAEIEHTSTFLNEIQQQFRILTPAERYGPILSRLIENARLRYNQYETGYFFYTSRSSCSPKEKCCKALLVQMELTLVTRDRKFDKFS